MIARAEAHISLKAIKQNIINLTSGAADDTKILAVIKADAYGHGSVNIAKYLNKEGIKNFAVATAEEGEELRNAGITGMILVLGKTAPELAEKLINFDLTQTCDRVDYAYSLASKGKIKIHIKIDTGMSRLGFYCHNKDTIEKCANSVEPLFNIKNLTVDGIFTHFADTDDEEYTRNQFGVFKGIINELEKRGHNLGIRHCCNSAATSAYPYMHLDMVRLGIGLYGLERSVPNLKMHPAMTVSARIASISEQQCGDSVSYGRTYTANSTKKIAVVSFGYADGMPRLLSNRFSVSVNKCKVPIVGRICMDMFMIDVTGIECSEGDRVTIFGSGDEVSEMADIIGTINYEIVCGINKRVPRIYTED